MWHAACCRGFPFATTCGSLQHPRSPSWFSTSVLHDASLVLLAPTASLYPRVHLLQPKRYSAIGPQGQSSANTSAARFSGCYGLQALTAASARRWGGGDRVFRHLSSPARTTLLLSHFPWADSRHLSTAISPSGTVSRKYLPVCFDVNETLSYTGDAASTFNPRRPLSQKSWMFRRNRHSYRPRMALFVTPDTVPRAPHGHSHHAAASSIYV